MVAFVDLKKTLYQVTLALVFLWFSLSGCAKNGQSLTNEPVVTKQKTLISPTLTLEMIPSSSPTPSNEPFVEPNSPALTESHFCRFKGIDSGGSILDYAWSPDGKRIMLSARVHDDRYNSDTEDIYVVEIAQVLGHTIYKPIAPSPLERRFVTSLAWFPDSTKAIYSKVNLDSTLRHDHFYTIDWDSGEVNELTHEVGYSQSYSYLMWSPDYTQMAFVAGSGGVGWLYTLDSSMALTDLLSRQLVTSRPAWSPNGQLLLYSASIRQNDLAHEQVYTIDVITREITQLTDSFECASQPIWSENGEKIAFEATYDEQLDIAVMDAITGEPRILNRPDSLEFSPTWVPNENKIVVVSNIASPLGFGVFGEAQDLYMVDLQDETWVQLTNTPKVFEFMPRWSPDGHYISYVAWNQETGQTSLNLFTPNPSDQNEIIAVLLD